MKGIMIVRHATVEDIPQVGELFDAYRVSYEQASDRDAAVEFIGQRMQNGDSVVFVAERDQELIGFTQLYPTFSSVAMRRVWVLNDLFVTPTARRLGVGRQLLEAAAAFGRSGQAVRLELATATDNVGAQRLYEGLSWKRDEVFLHYSLQLE